MSFKHEVIYNLTLEVLLKKKLQIFCCFFKITVFVLQYSEMVQPSILFILIFTILISQTATTDLNPKSPTDSLLYGVRWFLSENFQFQQPQPIPNNGHPPGSDLMMIFNTYNNESRIVFSLEVQSQKYVCNWVNVTINITEKHHSNFNDLASESGDTFTTFIYKCPVTFKDRQVLDKQASFEYRIFAQINNQTQIVFNATLRSPQPQKNDSEIAIFGDWGVITNFSKQFVVLQPINECLLAQLQDRPQIRLIILLGDMAYDLEGDTYIQFFEHIQEITQSIVLLLTPGNHQTIKHKDLFPIVQHSFHSPYWRHFFGYFQLISFGKYMFLGFNPDNVFQWLGPISMFEVMLKDKYGTYFDLIDAQLTQQAIEVIKGYTLIVVSHYPIYFSEEDQHQSNNKYIRLQKPYFQRFTKMGFDLFFSGHVHFYQRSKPICGVDNFPQPYKIQGNTSVYQMGCPMFIIEGAGGNNYFVETAVHYKLKQHSAVFVENTGFGLLTLHHNDGPQKMHFQHISTIANCQPVDTISWIHPKDKLSKIKQVQIVQISIHKQQFLDSVSFTSSTVIIIGVSLLIVVIFLVLVILAKRRKNKLMKLQTQINSVSHQNVLEMADHQLSH